jgi:hypothetical protein
MGKIRRGVLIVGLLVATVARGEGPAQVYYHYTDKNGTEVVVDDLAKVPPRYRDSVKALRVGEGPESEVRPRLPTAPAPARPVAPLGAGDLQGLLAYVAVRALLDAIPLWLAARLTRLPLGLVGAFIACLVWILVATVLRQIGVPHFAGWFIGFAACVGIVFKLGRAEGFSDVALVVMVAGLLDLLAMGTILRRVSDLLPAVADLHRFMR